jgi:glycosyltransferase involved in cell wall biosynthesis
MSDTLVIVGQLDAGIGRHVINYFKYVNPHAILVTDVNKSDPNFVLLLRERDVRVIDISIGKKPSPKDFFNIVKLFLNVWRLDVNVIIGHGSKGGLYSRLLKICKPNAKTFYAPHGGVLHYPSNSLTGKIYFFIERALLRLTTKIIFESSYSKEQYFSKIQNLKNHQFSMISNCIDTHQINTKRFTQDNKSPIIRICCAAQLRDLKGIDILIDALGRSTLQSNEFVCDIYGDGSLDDISRYQTQIDLYGLNGVVNLCGVKNILRLYADYDVYIQPSRFESFGLAAMEAYFAGCQLILSDTGGLAANFKSISNAKFFRSGSVEALITCLDTFELDRSNEPDPEFFCRFTPEAFTEKYLGALQSE